PVNNIDPDGMFTLTGEAAQNFARQLQSELDREEMRKLMSGEGDNPSGGIKDWWRKVTNLFKSEPEYEDVDNELEELYIDRRTSTMDNQSTNNIGFLASTYAVNTIK